MSGMHWGEGRTWCCSLEGSFSPAVGYLGCGHALRTGQNRAASDRHRDTASSEMRMDPGDSVCTGLREREAGSHVHTTNPHCCQSTYRCVGCGVACLKIGGPVYSCQAHSWMSNTVPIFIYLFLHLSDGYGGACATECIVDVRGRPAGIGPLPLPCECWWGFEL